jgi:hypothetical protein
MRMSWILLFVGVATAACGVDRATPTTTASTVATASAIRRVTPRSRTAGGTCSCQARTSIRRLTCRRSLRKRCWHSRRPACWDRSRLPRSSACLGWCSTRGSSAPMTTDRGGAASWPRRFRESVTMSNRAPMTAMSTPRSGVPEWPCRLATSSSTSSPRRERSNDAAGAGARALEFTIRDCDRSRSKTPRHPANQASPPGARQNPIRAPMPVPSPAPSTGFPAGSKPV